MQRLGRRIQELRKQRGWSQERFAEVCGVHRTYVGQIETARKPGISVMSVARAARALGIPLSELFSGLEQGSEARGKSPQPSPLAGDENPIRVGRNAIRIGKLIEELRLDRDALRQATRKLNQFAHKSKSPKRVRTRK